MGKSNLGAPLLLLFLLGAGCQGEIGIQGDRPTPFGSEPGPTTHTHNPEFPDLECEGVACSDPVPAQGARFIRLTHTQWENTTRDLLRLDARSGLSSSFLADPLADGHFDNDASVLDVTQRLWENYREAAESLAAQIARDENLRGRILGSDGSADLEEVGRTFVESFGARAYRRPLTSTEVDRHLELFMQGATLMPDHSPLVAGVEMLLRAFLQSPHFLYRTELAHSDEDEVVALDGYERAAKLSFALWGTMPDDELFAAAASGDLDHRAGLERQARRMIQDPRAQDAVSHFHAQLYHMDRFEEMEKDPDRFPEFSPAVARAMRDEMELFIRDVIFDGEGDVRDLYLANHAYINQDLSSVYNVDGDFSDGFERVALNPEERAGLLTRAGWLAYEATAFEQNTIHRGVFVNLNVLCVDLPPIPDDVPIPDNVMGDTNRQRVSATTDGCGGACHSSWINPAGFAFENYDALGRFQREENGHPVDASGRFYFNGQHEFFQNAVEFSRLIAESPEAHDCYTQHWFEFAYGRKPRPGDAPLLARISQASEAGVAKVQDMIVSLVVNDIFVTRATGNEEGSL